MFEVGGVMSLSCISYRYLFYNGGLRVKCLLSLPSKVRPALLRLTTNQKWHMTNLWLVSSIANRTIGLHTVYSEDLFIPPKSIPLLWSSLSSNRGGSSILKSLALCSLRGHPLWWFHWMLNFVGKFLNAGVTDTSGTHLLWSMRIIKLLFGISPLCSFLHLSFPVLVVWTTRCLRSIPPCLSVYIKITCCRIQAHVLTVQGCSQACVCFVRCVHVCVCLCVLDERTDALVASGLVFSFWQICDLCYCAVALTTTRLDEGQRDGQKGHWKEESVDCSLVAWQEPEMLTVGPSLITVGTHYQCKCGIITVLMLGGITHRNVRSKK